MELYASPITLLLLINCVVLTLLGFYLIFGRDKKGSFIYACLMFAIAIWALFSAAENASLNVADRILFAKISYIGILASGPLWLLFTLKYTELNSKTFRTINSILIIIYFTFLLLVFTNDFHNLLWTSYELIDKTVIQGVIFGHGPIWYMNVLYQYIMILTGIFILIKTALTSKGQKRKFLYLLVLATAIPWVFNIIYIISGGQESMGVDLAPISFAISGIIIAFSIFKYQYFTTISTAINYIYSSIEVGIIIFDENKKIINFNVSAEKYICNKLVLNKQIEQLDKITGLQFSKILIDDKNRTVVKNSDDIWIELSSSTIQDDNKKIVGYAITIYDINIQINIQDKLDSQIKKLSTINNLMVGRELKMIELKNTISRLEKNSSKKPIIKKLDEV